jgi:hypothetical protein
MELELTPEENLPEGEVRGSATVTIDLEGGETIEVTGSYASADLELSGQGYAMTATLEPDRMVGAYEGPRGKGTFAAMCGPSDEVVVYCGTATLEGQALGGWNLVRQDDQFTGSYTADAIAESGHFIGTLISETEIALEFDVSTGGSGTAEGVLSGDTVIGTWEFPALTGTWEGSSGACP